MANPRILVSGATGNTGGSIVRQLDDAGVEVRALTRDPGKAEGLAGPNVEIVAGDLSDPASLVAAMKGIDVAYLNVVPSPVALDQVDNFIAAAKQAGVKHILKLSGMNATPDSRSAIIRLHAEGDQRVRDSGMTYSILRANSFYQNILSQLDGIRTNGQFYLPLGDARQSLIDVADIAAVAVARMMEANAQSTDLDLTGPESISFAQVAEELGKALGREVTYVPISSEAFQSSLIEVGLPEPVASSVAELFSVFAEGTYANVSDDVEKTLGRAPRSYAAFAADVARMG